MLSEIKLLIIGCGKMGSSMLDGWITAGLNPDKVVIIDPFANAEDLSDKCRDLYKTHEDLESFQFDICVIAVKPQNLKEIISGYKKIVNDDCVFLSVAAGVKIETIKNGLGKNSKVARIMPNLPAVIKSGLSGVYFEDNISEKQKTAVISLLKANGEVISVDDERDIDKITAISGSGPAYIFNFIESLEKIAKEYGFSDNNARLLAEQTVYGAAKMAKNSEISAKQLREDVTSPGGTTQSALNILMDQNFGLEGLLRKAVKNAKTRSEELAS